MKKTEINSMIAGLKKTGLVVQVTPWLFEQRQQEKVEVRHVGIIVNQEWQEVLSDQNRLLLTFVYSKHVVWCDVLLANSVPFILIDSIYLQSSDKIENLLGNLRRRLKQDKTAFLHHKDHIGNVYKKIAHKIKA